MATDYFKLPPLEQIRKETYARFRRYPCLWQARVAQEVLKGENDVICIAPTGSGKTLTFWMPLLFRPDGIQIVVTPLNILGVQNDAELASLNISSVAVSAETASPALFKEIEEGKYRVVLVNPEELMKEGGAFERILKKDMFASRIISIVWDEAHCINAWGSFRPEYKESRRLRNYIPKVRFLLASATFAERTQKATLNCLDIDPRKCVIIRRSNDRPNVHLIVRKLAYSQSSFQDLDFLIPTSWKAGDSLPKFVVFFDNIDESQRAADRLRARLPFSHRSKVVWFNSRMTAEFREENMRLFKDGSVFGFYSTDSFGMGINIPDIDIVVQWRLKCDIDTLWQRFGRAARDPTRTAVAILLVEPKYFDEAKDRHKRRVRQRTEDLQNGAEMPAATLMAPVEGDAVFEPAIQTKDIVLKRSVDFEALRREWKASAENAESHTHKRPRSSEPDIAPELDALVNASTRSFGCYRIPVNAYYGNDKIDSDHRQCRPDLVDGCPRCAIKTSPICCALCSPDDLTDYLLHSDSTPALSRKLKASHLKKTPSMTDTQNKLIAALHCYRKRRAKEDFGRAMANNLGPSIVLPNGVLKRLVDCAHAKKIQTVDDIKRETKWNQAHIYGEEVLKIITEHYPDTIPFITTPLQPRPQALNVSKTVRQITCSVCGEVGHNRTNRRLCKKHPQYVAPTASSLASRSQAMLENIPETSPVASTPTPQFTLTPMHHPIWTPQEAIAYMPIIPAPQFYGTLRQGYESQQ